VALTKTEGGVEYPAEAYLHVPDPEKPSTWKLRVWETPEKQVTVAQLGRAAAALGRGFRGRRVELSAEERATALRTLRGLYRKAGIKADDLPPVLQDAVAEIAAVRLAGYARKIIDGTSVSSLCVSDHSGESPILMMAEDAETIEAYYGGSMVAAQQDGAPSLECLLGWVKRAFAERAGSDAPCEVIATFPDRVVYEEGGHTYQVSYTVGDGAVVLGDDIVEVAAEFMPVTVTAQEAQQAVQARDLREDKPPATLREARLDRQNRVISGTVLITAESSNGPAGRRYSTRALQQIAHLAEGLPAYVNHTAPELSFKPRDVRELIGRHRNVRYDADRNRVSSDLHILEHQSPWVMALAEEMGDVVGNSLVSRGVVRLDNGVEVVEDISAVRSVDLVSDPAATRGLFEHRQVWNATYQEEPMSTKVTLTQIEESLAEDTAIGAALRERLAGADLKAAAETAVALKAEVEALKAQLAESQAKVDAFESAQAIQEKATRLEAAIAESDLGKKFSKVEPAVTPKFRELLLAAPEADWPGLLEDRVSVLAAATSTVRPQSTLKEDRQNGSPDLHQRILAAL
jgi:hypothetical protein